MVGLAATRERYPVTKTGHLRSLRRSFPRSGPSLHETEKVLASVAGAKLTGDLATLFPELKEAMNDVTNADTSRRGGRLPTPWREKSVNGSGYPRVGLKKRVEEKFCGPRRIRYAAGFPAKSLEMIVKILQISEPSLDVTCALCPLTG